MKKLFFLLEIFYETKILMRTLERRERERELTFWLENQNENKKGMPLGNLTSQFFANIYLNELDYFVKHILKAKYYLRYVDDFVILHRDKKQLEKWKIEIDRFLRDRLKLELHPQKSKVILLSKGVDFVGFRNFYFYTLIRKRNIRKMRGKIKLFKEGMINYRGLMESFQGWNAYAIWADSFGLRREVLKDIASIKSNKISELFKNKAHGYISIYEYELMI